jgi:hypothetical protein
MSKDIKALVEGGPIIRAGAGAIAFPYAAAGAAFTNWFNDQARRLPNFRLMLGTEAAHVVSLHEDGRLECEVETEALEPERRFVAFEAQHLDQLVHKLASLSGEAS